MTMEQERPNLPESKPFKILSIDGGGIKGLYAATILKRLEESIRAETDQDVRIADYFDLICGTSTGGLIALALSQRISCEKICRFYEKHGPLIFSNSRSPLRWFRQIFFRGKYSDKKLRFALKELFKTWKISDSQTLLCIPSYNFTESTPAIFKFDHKNPHLSRHNNLSMVDVALATAAAPSYFPLAQIELMQKTQYVDGGVWANNPSILGLTEALRDFVGKEKHYNAIQMLSIANLTPGKGKPLLKCRHRSIIRWRKDLFDLSLIGQSKFADDFLYTLAQNSNLTFNFNYVRIPSAKIDADQFKKITFDKAGKDSLDLIKLMANTMYDTLKDKLLDEKIFSSKKSFNTTPLSPSKGNV